ncbi:hypothetical protein AB0I28_23655 [Phytomonospora sp. NPDC050363]|uniref:hypothetical protein n=1 Tax=Phytomonospora sp. NPDC050363 TaxID=3155642 RepID=UPI0033D5E831
MSEPAPVIAVRGYVSAGWRLAVAVVFAVAGATLPATAFLVHMNGTGALNGRADPYVFALRGLYFHEWHARQGVLVAACLGLACWLVLGAVDRVRAARAGDAATPPLPVWRGRVAGVVLGVAGLVMAAGAVVPAEAYHYYFRAHGPKYDGTAAYVFSDEGLGWAAWDGVLAVACVWAGVLLLRAGVRAWGRRAGAVRS